MKNDKSYLMGTHYFGEGSPINMWSTINEQSMIKSFEEFKGNGFNSVVILIPWAAFHQDINSKNIDPKYAHKLKLLFKIAHENGLQVILRVGYLWDSTPTNMHTYERFSRLPIDRHIMDQWLWFLRAIYNLVKDFDSYAFSFLSWEDFYWPIYRYYQDTNDIKQLKRFAQDTGFENHVSKIESYSYNFNPDLNEFNVEHDFKESSKWYSFYTNYYDNTILRTILDMSNLVFDNLSFEYRVDPEWVVNDAQKSFHDWSVNYHNSSIPVIYYHANIGRKHTDNMSLDQANAHLSNLLERFSPMKDLGQCKPYIDQLNFTDDTYENWAGIDLDNATLYATKIFETMKNKSSGYAIWGYRDWRKNAIHNPFFYRESEGWSYEGNVEFANDSLKVVESGKLKQSIPHLQLDQGERYILVRGSTKEDEITINTKVTVDNIKYEFNQNVSKDFVIKIDIQEAGSIQMLELDITGSTGITEISLLGRSFSQGFASEDGTLSKVAEGIVEMQKNYTLELQKKKRI